MLDSIVEPGFKNFDEVKDKIERDIKSQKSKDAALEEANNLLIKLSSEGSTIEKLIDENKNIDGFIGETKTLAQGFTSLGRSDYVNGALLNAAPGDLLGPLQTNRGQAIINLIDKADFDSTEFELQKENLRDAIFSRKQNQFFQSWIDDLKNNAEIIDNRKYYF